MAGEWLAAEDALTASDLSAEQLSNLNRFVSKLPSGAGDATITRLPDGSV